MPSNDQGPIDVTKAFIVLSIEEELTYFVSHGTLPKGDKSFLKTPVSGKTERQPSSQNKGFFACRKKLFITLVPGQKLFTKEAI